MLLGGWLVVGGLRFDRVRVLQLLALPLTRHDMEVVVLDMTSKHFSSFKVGRFWVAAMRYEVRVDGVGIYTDTDTGYRPQPQ